MYFALGFYEALLGLINPAYNLMFGFTISLRSVWQLLDLCEQKVLYYDAVCSMLVLYTLQRLFFLTIPKKTTQEKNGRKKLQKSFLNKNKRMDGTFKNQSNKYALHSVVSSYTIEIYRHTMVAWPSSAKRVDCLCIISPLHCFNHHQLAPVVGLRHALQCSCNSK